MQEISITDKQTMIYLDHKKIYPEYIKKVGSQVTQVYKNTPEFKKAIEHDYDRDENFHGIMSSIKKVEEKLRVKMQEK